MRGILLAAVLVWPALAHAQDHQALTIIRPMPVGSAGAGWDAGNRIYRAYTGLEYNIPVVVIGGEFPYTCELQNAPAGMTVSNPTPTAFAPGYLYTACEVTWTNPTSDATPGVRACDADGDCTAYVDWTIDVTTTGFYFINADTGSDAAACTRADPCQTLDKMYDLAPGSDPITYLVGNGPFTLAGIPTSSPGDCELMVEFREPGSGRSIIWLDEPSDGLTPVVDIGWNGVDPAPCILLTGQNIWVDGLEVTNINSQGFQNDRRDRFGAMYRRNYFHGGGHAIGGGNSSVLMWNQTYGGGGSPNTQVYYDAILNNRFADIDAIGAAIMYSWLGGIVANNTLTGEGTDFGGFAIKTDDSNVTVRANSIVLGADDQFAVDGNMDTHNDPTDATYGEILFNYFDTPDGMMFAESRVSTTEKIGPWYVYRNTNVGPVYIRGAWSGDGVYQFTNNVIINSQAAVGSCPIKVTCDSVTDYSKIVMVTNLEGVAADGIVNASGELQGAYAVYVGSRGWQIGSGIAAGSVIRLRRTGP